MMSSACRSRGAITQGIIYRRIESMPLEGIQRKDSFKPGDVVTITLETVKSGAPNGRIAQAILADGTELGNAPGEPGRGRGEAEY